MPNATDLLALNLTLRPLPMPEDRGDLPQWWGRAAHQCLLGIFQEQDLQTSIELHDGSQPRPFTVSSLQGYETRRGLSPQQMYTLRVTSLTPEVSALLMAAAQPGGKLSPASTIELDRLGFTVLDCQQEETGFNYQQLTEQYLMPGRAVPRQVQIEFTSPTGFKKDGEVDHLFPEPVLVFGSLLRRWNEFAPLALPDELNRYARECLRVSAYSLRTQSVRLTPEITLVGAVGWVRYAATHFDRYWMSLVQALAKFSAYSGVGAKLSMGFGQARLMEQRGHEGSRV